jgi:integrase/recombinase XerD
VGSYRVPPAKPLLCKGSRPAALFISETPVRDYTILNLLFDSGARASEVAALDLDYFDSQQKTLAILGKGSRVRMITLWPKTADLLYRYVEKYRTTPHALYKNRLFLNQRGKELTRHGIYRLCLKYMEKVLPAKRLKDLNPAHIPYQT